MKYPTHRLLLSAAAFILLATQTAVPATGAAAPVPPPPNVAARAWAAAQSEDHLDLLVTVPGYPDLTPADALASKEARTRFVAEALIAHAGRAQRALRRALDARGTAYQVLWISNALYLPRVRPSDLAWLAARPDVAWIDLDVKWKGVQSEVGSRRPAVGNPVLSTVDYRLSTVEWSVAMVRAPEVWARGFNGQGIVIADLDTGVQWDHPGVRPAYRGWNGVTATHDTNWLDPTGKSVAVPTDDRSHGTHTVGTLVGDDGLGNQTGVAPGAQWIACRNMNSGFGSVALYTACFQFALAPTDVNGNHPDPALAADLTSNSWTCEPSEEGCPIPSSLVTPTQALRSAGIMIVAAAGNYGGGGCDTVQYAPGTLDQSFTAGAVGSGGSIAYFSSRGPSTFTGRIKPDLVAPGADVRSTVPTNGYGTKSGTSMATPHVAGVVALLWSAAPWLRGQIDETEALLRATARPLTTTFESCGGVPGTQTPNNTYGHGLIDAQAAISAALDGAQARAWAPPVARHDQPVVVSVAAVNAYRAYTLTDAILTATLPLSVSVVAVSGGGVITGGAAVWALGAIGPATSMTLAMTVTVSGPGVYALADFRLAHAGRAEAVAAPPLRTLMAGTWLRSPLTYGDTATLKVSQAKATSP